MTLTSQRLSRVVASVLVALGLAVVFSGLVWEFWGDAPGIIIALGVWVVLVVALWLWLRRRDSTNLALRAVPIAAAFAPTIVSAGPMFAFPLPASLALPLLMLGAFVSPPERLGRLVAELTLAASSLAVVWVVSFLVIRRHQRL